MNTLLRQGTRIPRAEMQCHDPDDDTQEVEVPIVVIIDDDGEQDAWDDDRRRSGFEGEHLLHLTGAEWELIDDLTEWRVPLTGIGSRCAHTPHRLPDGLVVGVCLRPSPVMGGTFLIFPGE